ncbi:MAG: response regulator, partial [bacterium]
RRPMMTNKLRILLADDHETVREGLRMILNAQPDMQVVATAGDGQEAVAQAERVTPDVVIMDISMPGLNGLAATTQLTERCPDAKVLTLTRHADSSYLQQMLRAGAAGYVLKRSSPSELVLAIGEVLKGRTYLAPQLAGTMAQSALHPTGRSSTRDKEPHLTPRQREVLQLIAEGHSSKEIARILNISIKTVEFHKTCLMDQLGMRTTAELTRFAIAHGLA